MRRFANMNDVAKAAIATTAAMVAVVCVSLLLPSSSPSATARLGSSPTAASLGLISDSHGARQTLTEQGVRFSFKVPTKAPGERSWWERFRVATGKYPRGPISLNKSFVGPQGAEAIIYWTSFPDGDYADPCAQLLAPSIGRSAAALAAAVATAPGTKLVKGPSDVTLGGHPAKHVVLAVRKNVGCDPGFFYSWANYPLGGAFWHMNAGDTIRVWIVAVGGTRLFIAAATRAGALEEEVQQIVESIRFA
jgi:hypothetical protein